MRNTNIAILGIGLLVIGVIIYFYGSRLTGKIKQLAQTADSISMGDLDRGVQVHSKDEIGELGDAISRMQTSLKISLSHLG
jgi:methyl-accepting chemotaxis protein